MHCVSLELADLAVHRARQRPEQRVVGLARDRGLPRDVVHQRELAEALALLAPLHQLLLGAAARTAHPNVLAEPPAARRAARPIRLGGLGGLVRLGLARRAAAVDLEVAGADDVKVVRRAACEHLALADDHLIACGGDMG